MHAGLLTGFYLGTDSEHLDHSLHLRKSNAPPDLHGRWSKGRVEPFLPRFMIEEDWVHHRNIQIREYIA